jgi:hypothetical protein
LQVGGNSDKTLVADLAIECETEAVAKQTEQVVQAMLTLAESPLQQLAAKIEQSLKGPQRAIPGADPAEGPLLQRFANLALELLKNRRLQQHGTTVELATQAPVADLPQVIAQLLPAIEHARGAAQRAQSMNTLKHIALAIHTYADAKKVLPPAYTASPDGKPLLSWRVAILPFLGETELYGQFHQDEPWDSDHNKQLIEKIPAIYRSAKWKPGDVKTSLVTPRGEGTAFPGAKPVKFTQIADGTSKTIMMLQLDDAHSVVWTKPDDWEFDPTKPTTGLAGQHQGGIVISLCDGSTMWMPTPIDGEALKAYLNRNDGLNVPIEKLIGQ